MALKGTIKDFGIADIFQLIGQQGKTGVLHLIDREDQVQVGFKDGAVVRAESSTRRKKELLGDMLVRAGLITEHQLEEALEEQKRTLKRLGDILVASEAISREALRKMAELQTTETLYRLFFWKTGDYEFEAAEVEYDPDAITPLRSESVLMEGFRRVDEWPVIRKKIPSATVTFEQLKPLPAAGAQDDDVDSALDDAFGEGGPKEPGGEKGDFKNVGDNERLVYGLVEKGRDVQAIIDRSRLGEFEACKALLNLLNLGFVKSSEGKAVAAGQQGGARWGERLVAATSKLAATVLLVGVVGLLAVRLEHSAQGASSGSRYSEAAPRRLASRSQLSRLDSAIAVFTLEKGSCPGSLSELAGAGILSEGDLRYPWGEEYYYRKTGPATYVLLPPLR